MRPISSSYDTGMARARAGFASIRTRLEAGEIVDHETFDAAIDEYGDAGWHELRSELHLVEVPGEGYRIPTTTDEDGPMTTTTTARDWLDARGFVSGDEWVDEEGNHLRDLLRAEFGAPSRLWVGDTQGDATPHEAWILEDGSAVIVLGDTWDLVEGYATSGGYGVWTDESIDDAIQGVAGVTVSRGYLQRASGDDSAGRWYVYPSDGPVDHRGAGYATLDEAEAAAWATLVRGVRYRLDLSQQALADALGVHLRTLQAWEGGEAQPQPYLWRALRDLEDR